MDKTEQIQSNKNQEANILPTVSHPFEQLQNQVPVVNQIVTKEEQLDSEQLQQLTRIQEQELMNLEKSLQQTMAASTPTTKRKKVVLNFNQKLEILDKLKAGSRIVEIAREYNIGVTTVCDIRRQGDEKFLKYRKENLFNLNRKSTKTSEFPLLDKALKIWVYQERIKQYTLTDAIFQAKAVEFFHILYPETKRVFKASHGYVSKFCSRYDMSLKNEPSKMYADLSKFDAFILDLHDLNYVPEQIYNADECGLNYRELPILSETKEKVSLMLCSNASGRHKLPLMLINKTPIDLKKVSVQLEHSSRGWQTQEIFENWFHREFVPKVRAYLSSIHLEEKALLLVDNCPSHPMRCESPDGKIKCLFLPSGCHTYMPMNQGPIAYLKRKYRTNFLRAVCADQNFLDKQTIKNTIYSLANIWEEIPESLLRTCWQSLKINVNVTNSLEPIDMVEIRNNFNSLGLNLSIPEINNWLDTDFDDPGYGFLTDEEILDSARADGTPLNSSLERPCPVVSDRDVIDSSKAYTYCDELMQWLETQENSKPKDLIFIQRVKELASRSRLLTMNCVGASKVQLNANPDVGSHVTQQATENNIVGEAETLTLCFLSGSGSMKDTNGKIIIQDGTSL